MKTSTDTSCRRPFQWLGLLFVFVFLGESAVIWQLHQPADIAEISALGTSQLDLTQLAIENEQPKSLFGASVALASGKALVGCPLRYNEHDAEGAAYLFSRDRFGRWQSTATLVAKHPQAFDSFGWSVALGNHSALVGTCPSVEAQSPDRPSAYLFTSAGSSPWRQSAEFTLGDIGRCNVHNVCVAMEGDTILIGRTARDLDCDRLRGDAYLYHPDDRGDWRQVAKLTTDPSTPANFNNFGTAVALDCGLVAIGASTEMNSTQDTGATYVYQEEPDGAWRQLARLTADDAHSGYCFGNSVAVAGGMVFVGAPGADGPDDTLPNAGAAYLYRQPSANAAEHTPWIQVAKLVPANAADWDCFGATVALSGNIALVGAPGRDAVYAFRIGDDLQVTQVAEFAPPVVAPRSGFARAIALHGDTLVAGAPWDNNSGHKAGAAYWTRLPAQPTPAVYSPRP